MSSNTPLNKPEVVGLGGSVFFEDTYESRGGSWGVDDTRCNRSYVNRLKISTPTQYVGPVQILLALPVKIGDTYKFPLAASSVSETDTGSFVQSINLDFEDGGPNGATWIATITYEPFDVNHELGTSDISDGLINPMDRYPEVFWSNAKYKRSKPEDVSDPPKPFINTAGDPLLDPPEFEETRPCLKFVRNESIFNDDYASLFKDATNSDVFLGYPPNTVKCKDIMGERVYDPDWGNYFRVTYEFEFRDDDDTRGYTELIHSLGYRQKVGGTGPPVQIKDPNGQLITDAVGLKQDGSYVPGADPYFIEFTLLPSIEFAGLNIPDDVLTAQT